MTKGEQYKFKVYPNKVIEEMIKKRLNILKLKKSSVVPCIVAIMEILDNNPVSRVGELIDEFKKLN